MIKITVDDACSFARSFDEHTRHSERFYEETAVWLCTENPVLGHLLSEMATRLSGGDTKAANVCLATAGYGLRLLEHAAANRNLFAAFSATQQANPRMTRETDAGS